MQNLQIFLLYNHPDYFTKEPLLKQLKEFASLDLDAEFAKLSRKCAAAIERYKQADERQFQGADFLNLLQQLTEGLQKFSAKPVFNTDAARHAHAEFVHYLRHLRTEVVVDFIVDRDGRETSAQYDLPAIKEATKKQVAQGIAAVTQNLTRNISQRISEFQKRVEGLLEKQLQALRIIQVQQAHEAHVAATQALAFIKERFEAWQERSSAEDASYDPQSILDHLLKIEKQQKRIQALVMQAGHNRDTYPGSATAQSVPGELATFNDSVEAIQRHALKLWQTMQGVTAEEQAAAARERSSAKKALKHKLDRIIKLVGDYAAELKEEKKSWSYFFNVFHWSRKEAKIKYCDDLLRELSEARENITHATNLRVLVRVAHQKAYEQSKDKSAIMAGGSYVGTSRLLSLQRLLDIESAWQHGKSKFGFFCTTASDFHGLKATGIIETKDGKIRRVINNFYQGTEAQEEEYNQLISQSLKL
ncbi:hypothetical protein [Legionella oakridgensis]|uniref:hypothetical protein n=1 Tax=Legionella oakridgensis TaxID=29423 RepID=UPI0003DE5E50|nr:hypothetical protein [Legionella oakridgensis]ETO93904.1 hypothetical protein LOR_78c22340 [Legionella oakridgensis RV-2-2007]